MKTRGMLSELTELTSADGDTLVYHNIRCIARLYSIIYDVQYLFEIIALSFDMSEIGVTVSDGVNLNLNALQVISVCWQTQNLKCRIC